MSAAPFVQSQQEYAQVQMQQPGSFAQAYAQPQAEKTSFFARLLACLQSVNTPIVAGGILLTFIAGYWVGGLWDSVSMGWRFHPIWELFLFGKFFGEPRNLTIVCALISAPWLISSIKAKRKPSAGTLIAAVIVSVGMFAGNIGFYAAYLNEYYYGDVAIPWGDLVPRSVLRIIVLDLMIFAIGSRRQTAQAMYPRSEEKKPWTLQKEYAKLICACAITAVFTVGFQFAAYPVVFRSRLPIGAWSKLFLPFKATCYPLMYQYYSESDPIDLFRFRYIGNVIIKICVTVFLLLKSLKAVRRNQTQRTLLPPYRKKWIIATCVLCAVTFILPLTALIGGVGWYDVDTEYYWVDYYWVPVVLPANIEKWFDDYEKIDPRFTVVMLVESAVSALLYCHIARLICLRASEKKAGAPYPNEFNKAQAYAQQPMQAYAQQPVQAYAQQPVQAYVQQPVQTYAQQPMQAYAQQLSEDADKTVAFGGDAAYPQQPKR